MTFSSTLSLAIAMLILAATPGPGILLVSSQTATHNLRAGFLTTLGIICADIVFILLITYGLASLTKNLQDIMVFINIFGGFYLIFIGFTSLKNKAIAAQDDLHKNTSYSKKHYFQFLASGFLITLSNPKAILFYLSFLPAFVDINNLRHVDVIIIMLTAIFTITPTMMAYALLSNKAAKLSQQDHSLPRANLITKVSAVLIILVGCYMLYRATL